MNIPSRGNNDFDAIVIGAGFSGLYMLHRLREAGFHTRVFETGDGVGGVWYWNRYPGARCDSESIYYNYTFSEELLQEWTWSSRYPEQPEILRYLNYVADKFDLRRDIQFQTRVTAAHYDEDNHRWRITLKDGTQVSATYFISGVGCLSAANIPKFKGLDTFQGKWYHTGHWPQDEKVVFKGKRVGVIGNGSSGVQSIPVIAKEAGHLTVFQRTPQYTIPARNHPYDPAFIRQTKETYSQIIPQLHESWAGFPIAPSPRSALDDSPEVRHQVYETAWEKGGFFLTYTYNDLTINEASNETAAAFIRSKIRETVHNPEVAEKLVPHYYFGTKRPILDTHYYETYNRENVTLVDVKAAPIVEITPKGIRTTEAEYELDILVFATGYDGMTGPLLKIDIRGKNGLTLKEKWANGGHVQTYLGLANAGFPNFFMITGPESPSVLANMPLAIEQHVDWIGDCLQYLRGHGVCEIEATPEAEQAWSKHCKEVADTTLYPKADSWYTGANIAGKPRSFLIYLGGFGVYRNICLDVASKGYEGFSLVTSPKTVS
ncbi:NAD(P)/FAD-dependent oxidoreductase [Brevibacillus nitrificans]|uniref:NAD(P)/FAD-dependent oxidoreductase n=1 Tax=Brevibacillus nitrificans TaxID=651560 RepID=A0A3M8D566_9BACL|nr:NAD(P)/FAD-dependent oxidoreductase [Brevibacillus nitrificans]RNB83180.1 NAD(P)/FAD-dependent oxidoreductase [Brevibacillus nitrificans]